MFSRTCARRMVGPLAVAALLVAMLVMAPRALAEEPPAQSAASTLLAQASWHGRPIVHPRKQSEPRAALPPIRSIHGWTAGAARIGLGFVRPDGSKRVREVQRLLVLIGYRPGRIDGRFGPRTEAAVIAFQYKHGFAQSGVVASRTLKALRLRAGWSVRVRDAQRALNARGYEAGPVDGLFGPQTEAATKRFERRHGLPVDGVIDVQTARALGVTHTAVRPRERAPEPVERPAPVQPRGAPELPTALLLIGLGILGLLVTMISFVLTGRRLKRQRPEHSTYFPGWKEEP
jgi:peptidoglycan hydrolase-like protein with peptidoglycan-binding domain